MLRKDPEERCDPRADAAEHANAQPLNAVIAAVPILPEGGLEGTLFSKSIDVSRATASLSLLQAPIHTLTPHNHRLEHRRAESLIVFGLKLQYRTAHAIDHPIPHSLVFRCVAFL